jgi:hypothetical protein
LAINPKDIENFALFKLMCGLFFLAVDKKKENKGTQKVGNAEEDNTAGSDSEDEETAAAAKTAGKQESGNEDKKAAEQQKSVDAEEDETHTAVESTFIRGSTYHAFLRFLAYSWSNDLSSVVCCR